MLIRDGACLRMKEGGPVLGILPDRRYLQGEIDLQSGDWLVLFTDGVTEARGPSGREFGEDRLEELLNQLLNGAHKLRAAELRDRIMEAVKEFSDGEVYDDATLMIVRVD
jgi:sigma-B regulation protein RsbU (phosphoserine phosphatase)